MSEETKKLAREQFGREARKYVTSIIHSSESDLEYVKDFIDPQMDWDVLDIATGTGHLALALASLVKSVLATDITGEMLQEANQQANSHGVTNFSTQTIDVHEIPHESSSFDLTTSRIAPHHFHDIKLAIGEMVRVTRPEGYIFIQDTIAPDNGQAALYFNQIEKLRDPSHVRDLSLNEWTALLEVHKCQVVKMNTKPKNWPLRWWTERMSTTQKKVNQIITILESIYDEYHEIIGITRNTPYPSRQKIDDWTLIPHNGYFLAKKSE